MALLKIGDRHFDAGLVALDKDGTLIDFEFMWGRMAMAWIEHLARGRPDDGLRQDLYRGIGYDPKQRRADPSGPLAIATTRQLESIMSGTLYRHGTPWPDAEDRTREAVKAGFDVPLADLVRPTGDVAGLVRRLRAAGVRVAVVTTDDRALTEETLRILGVDGLIDALVCGDEGLPPKPAPDMLLAVYRALAVDPARTAVVGDTLGDLRMARRAGAGLTAAVLTGGGSRALLGPEADVVLESIDDIVVLDRLSD